MRDPVIKQLVARVTRSTRCPKLRLGRAKRVNCRQAGKLIAQLPLGTVYNRARANRTIRLLLSYMPDADGRLLHLPDTSSCSQIDPCNRRNVLYRFATTEYQIEIPKPIYVKRTMD